VRKRWAALVAGRAARYTRIMSSMIPYVAVAACLAVLAVLAVGLGGFAGGGAFNRKWGNKLMQLRVAMQFVAVVVIVLMAWLFGGK